MRIGLRVPSGSQRGTRKHDSPRGLRERQERVRHRRRAEPFVAGQRVARPSPGRRPARVVLARTSEPPCFSVIAIPMVAPAFSTPE